MKRRGILPMLLAVGIGVAGCGGWSSARDQAAKQAAHTYVQDYMASRSLPHQPLGSAEHELEKAALESPKALGETAAHLFWEEWRSVVYPTTFAHKENERQILGRAAPRS